MKKNIFLVIVAGLLFMLGACSKPTSYTVTGILPDNSEDGKQVYITRLDDYKNVDTATVQGNKFVFEGVADEPSFCRIRVKMGLYANIILENGDIVLDFNESKYPTGTKNNEELSRINQMEDSQYRELSKGMREALRNKKSVKAFKEEYNQKLKERAKELFNEHRNDVIGYYLLYSSYLNILDEDERKEVIINLGPSLKETSRAKFLQEKMNKN